VSGFIATPPAESTIIKNDGWWPDIDPQACRDILRIDGTVTPERLRAVLIDAIAAVNVELDAWKAEQTAAGHASLAEVPAASVDGDSVQTQRYQRAVRSTAGAHLIERYRNYDITDAGQKKADEQTPSIDELRRDARWAIADIKGKTHATVELI
jgi:hypothetical protein